jgi:hypothetical protein
MLVLYDTTNTKSIKTQVKIFPRELEYTVFRLHLRNVDAPQLTPLQMRRRSDCQRQVRNGGNCLPQ